jgi:hypothetical protein
MILESMFKQLNMPYDAVINGDDSVVALQEADLPRALEFSKEHFDRMGVIAKMVVVRDLHEVDFCQGKIVKTIEGYRLVRHPARAISHTSVSVKRYGGKRWLAWLRAVGECEVATNKGVPVLQALGECLMRNAWAGGRVNAANERDLFYRKGGEKVKSLEVTAEARYWFWEAFGVTPAEQYRLEQYYDNLNFVDSNYIMVLDERANQKHLPELELLWTWG